MEKVTPEDCEPYIRRVMSEMTDLLLEKNESYAASIFRPGRLGDGNKDPEARLWCRIEDKLNRLESGREFPGDNDLKDLMGYFAALLAVKEMKKENKIV